MRADGWTQIENSHLLKGGCTRCGTDTLAAPGQTKTALCGPCRLDRAHEITRGGTDVAVFSAPSVAVPEVFRKKTWLRGDDGVIRDRWKRYVLPDPVSGELREYTRVSTLKDVFSNSWNIRMWDRRTSVYGLAKSPDLVAQAAQAVPDAEGRFAPDNPWRDHLDRVAKLAFVAGGGEAGADNGTDWHRWRELFDAGTIAGAPDQVIETLKARQTEMQRHGLTVPAGMSERVVIIPELDAAGTFDELFEAADGTLFIGDEKSQRAFYDGGLLEAIQLAAYSRAKWIVDVAKVGNDPAANLAALTPMPAVDQHTAKIIWVPIGKGYAEVKDVDLTEAWGWAQFAVKLREDRKREWVTTAPAPQLPPVPDMADVHEPAWEDQPERDARRNPDGTTSQAVLDQISQFILEAPDRAALDRLWKDTGDLWDQDLIDMAQTRAAVLDTQAERAAAAEARAATAPEFCEDAGHAWNCEKPHVPGKMTIRDIIVHRLKSCRTADEMTQIWQTYAPAGKWDDGLTEAGREALANLG